MSNPSPHRARRENGVCRGSLWKQTLSGVASTPKEKKRSSKDQPHEDTTTRKTYDYCVLIGVLMVSYADHSAYQRGDHPTSVMKVVGASAWNSPSGLATEVSSPQTTFRMVTMQGTHLYCTAPTGQDCIVWLASLHSGLEASYSITVNDSPPMEPPAPHKSTVRRGGMFRDKTLSCQSCGRKAEIITLSTPLSHYGMENRCHVCPECLVAQGVWLDIHQRNQMFVTQLFERQTMDLAKEKCFQLLQGKRDQLNGQEEELVARAVFERDALQSLVSSPVYGTFRRSCPSLEMACSDFEHGNTDAVEFVEFLEDTRSLEMVELKKEAFLVAGDMGSAMKLLAEYSFSGDVAMLAHILNFFLDLCDDGEIDSVSFFWPQMQCLHLQMLPPRDCQQLKRVELMEDFLLTISARYSVHLALELTWGYIADLEESLFHTTSSQACRRRRFGVLRFVCELESLLFDFSNGWGGGSVALRNMLTPSPHQVRLLREEMIRLGENRCRLLDWSLSRSVRRDKLQKNKFQQLPERAAEEALKSAKNADYFSSHLSFTRRMCDIAEKLRLMDLEKRSLALEEELISLNTSGAMGGDPLNRVSKSLVRVVRVPHTEGHVFRSKERTPVLLLVEVVGEQEVEVTEVRPHKSIDDRLREQERRVRKSNGPTAEDAKNRRASNYAVDIELPDFSSENIDSSASLQVPDVTPSIPLNNPEEADQSIFTGTEDAPDRITDDLLGLRGTSQAEENGLLMSSNYPGHQSPRALLRNRAAQQGSQMLHSRNSMERLVNDVLIEQINFPDLGDEKEDGAEKGAQEEEVTLDGAVPRSTARLNRTLGNRRMTTLMEGETGNPLANDEIRRNVLTTIMTKGMRGSHAIAAGAAGAAQKSLQELDRKRAVEMILNGEEVGPAVAYIPPGNEEKIEAEHQRQKLLEMGIAQAEQSMSQMNLLRPQTEDDEAMESLRLLLLQNQAAQVSVGAENSDTEAEQHKIPSLRNMNSLSSGVKAPVDMSEIIEIDAGDVDSRLAGCGPLPPAVLSALTLWKGGIVTTVELLELVKKDLQYIQHVELSEDVQLDNSAFWGRFAFGERWAEKKARIAASSPDGSDPGWDLVGVIVKSNDDLRQEAFVMQLIELCREAFELAGLELWVHPYRILATGKTTGIIECVRNAMSFDALKKRPGYGKGGLREHLKRMSEFSPNPEQALQMAQQNFVRSLASYSLMSYFFLFKDRHNGNLLLDTAGHVIHIDFGFVFGVAPGGSFSLEMSTPFKLTEEMLEAMGGMQSECFGEFVTLFCCGFLTLQAHMDTFLTIVEITCDGSSFKCFEGRGSKEVVSKLRARFCPELSKEATIAFALDLIKQATQSYGTKQYDYFQYLSQGIAT